MEELISLLFAKTADSTLLNPKKAMNISLVTQLGVASCFCLTSVFLRHFSVVGFQLIVTGLLNILFAAGSLWIINKRPDSLSVGACLGSGVVISILSLTTAVYWGELSRCEILSVAVRKYTCDSKDAMRVLCVFSVLLFLLQIFFTFYLAKYKGHVLAASLQYSELPGADESDNQEAESSFTQKLGIPSWIISNPKENERDSLLA